MAFSTSLTANFKCFDVFICPFILFVKQFTSKTYLFFILLNSQNNTINSSDTFIYVRIESWNIAEGFIWLVCEDFNHCQRPPKRLSIFTVTHFYFLFFPCRTFTTSGSSYSSLLFFFSFIFYHHAFSVFSSFTGTLSDSFDCWELFFFYIFEGTYSPKVGNISLIFFWYVTGLNLA